MASGSGGVYEGITVKVSGEALKTAAENAQSRINKMVQVFESIDRLVARSSSYWIGEAGDAHRRAYESRKEEIQAALKRLKEHPGDLLSMASVYDSAESAARDLAAGLPSDVLS
ncbi:MAG TPA: hypothetical protein IAB23_04625 [Candidatus Scybalocola faecavium]|nr:hypothetical protein [Candidatus Scybalocola faecavium]